MKRRYLLAAATLLVGCAQTQTRSAASSADALRDAPEIGPAAASARAEQAPAPGAAAVTEDAPRAAAVTEVDAPKAAGASDLAPRGVVPGPEVRPAATSSSAPTAPPVAVPRRLRNGSPACGNVTTKAVPEGCT